MVLGSTQSLTEMSIRNISWGKGGQSVGLTNLPPSCAECLEIWDPQSPGTLRDCPALYRVYPALDRVCPALHRVCPALYRVCPALYRACPALYRVCFTTITNWHIRHYRDNQCAEGITQLTPNILCVSSAAKKKDNVKNNAYIEVSNFALCFCEPSESAICTVLLCADVTWVSYVCSETGELRWRQEVLHIPPVIISRKKERLVFIELVTFAGTGRHVLMCTETWPSSFKMQIRRDFNNLIESANAGIECENVSSQFVWFSERGGIVQSV
jgi:hypothetical protein